MKKILKNISLVASVLAVSVTVGYAVLAWTEPGAVPPGGTVAAPINTSSVAQGKLGPLGTGITTPATQFQVSYGDSNTTSASNGITILNYAGTVGNMAGIRFSTYADPDGGLYPKQFIGAIRSSLGTGNGDIVFLNRDAADGSVVTMADERMRITHDGKIGIGTANPTAKLEVNGTFKITDGNQGNGKVLTSDANGLASWQTASVGGPCKAVGATCSANANCCSNSCSSGACAASGSCAAAGISCSSNSACCSGLCAAGACVSNSVGVSCKAVGLTCTVNADCCTNVCGGAKLCEKGSESLSYGSFGQTLRNNGSGWISDNFLYNTGSALGINGANTAQSYVSGVANAALASGAGQDSHVISIMGSGSKYKGTALYSAMTSFDQEPVLAFNVFSGSLSNPQQSWSGYPIGDFAWDSCNTGSTFFGCYGGGAMMGAIVPGASTNGWGGIMYFYISHVNNTDGGNASWSRPWLTIRSTGNVIIGDLNNIGFTNSYRLELLSDSAGKPNGGSWANSSDSRLKKNIAPITGALEKISQLEGVNFEWINPQEHGNSLGVQGGFIAQDVEKVFPNWIRRIEPSNGDKSLIPQNDKALSLTLPFEYDALVVEAIKELNAKVDRIIKFYLAMKNGAVVAIDNLSAKTAFIGNLISDVVESGFVQASQTQADEIQMADKETGRLYCVSIAGGEWQKTKGPCAQ